MNDVLPAEVSETIEALCGNRVKRAEILTGGCISSAAYVEAGQERLFVKWRFDPPLEMFRAEAAGLERLKATNTLSVPEVIGTNYGDAIDEYCAFAYLAMEYIPNRKARDPKTFSKRFAHGLAALHQVASETGEYGLSEDNFIGRLPQRNRVRSCNWPEFYCDARLLPQIERAKAMGRLPTERERNLMRVVEKLPALLDGLPPQASLIHGDLWQCNCLCTANGEEPILIDPAVYYAPREMELAFIETFGGFTPRFRENYHQAFPLDEGYEHRRALHQLYPYLVHLNHFGEQYGPFVDLACRAYL